MKNAEATRAPGKLVLATNDQTLVVTRNLDADGNCRVVADVLNNHSVATKEDESNAEFIVRSWNAHDALVAALTSIMETMPRSQDRPPGMSIGQWHAARTALSLKAHSNG